MEGVIENGREFGFYYERSSHWSSLRRGMM